MDPVVLESFWQRSMPSSQSNICWWVLMDDLVASSPPIALLASSQRWPVSMGGAPLLGPGISAVGEGAMGISSREASAITASSGALTWDDVSTGPERSPSLLGEVWVQPWDLVFLGLSSLIHVQTCLIPPRTGASSLPWSCWPLFLPLAELPWWGWPSGWRGNCQG